MRSAKQRGAIGRHFLRRRTCRSRGCYCMHSTYQSAWRVNNLDVEGIRALQGGAEGVQRAQHGEHKRDAKQAQVPSL